MLPRRADPIIFTRLLAPFGFAIALGWWSPSVADDTYNTPSILQTPDIEALLTHRETANRSLGINLDRRRWGTLFPGAITFTTRLENGQTSDEPFLDSFSPRFTGDSNDPAYTISADWGSPDDRVTFSFTTRNADSLGSGGFLIDPQEDVFSLSRSLTANGWATTFTASVGNGPEDEFGGRTRKFGASASFLRSTDWAHRFGITAKLYQDWNMDTGLPQGDGDTSWELRTGGDLLIGGSRNTNPALPSLSIFFSVKGNATDDRNADSGDVDVTTGLTGKVHF